MSKNFNKKGFSLLEVLAVVIIIGILAALGYSSLNDLIQTNKAKETSRVLAAFSERALAESKMRKEPVTIILNGNTMRVYTTEQTLASQTFASGFAESNLTPNDCVNINSGIETQIIIGASGIEEGCFVACNAIGYCGSAIKTIYKNKFTAHYKRKNSSWEEL
ncbi:MAG: type II secretion system GspH family protein [Fibromonadales bacterium]|nr:type II secretion system GspH family protein [Fibromonadales bacterium]